MVTERSRKPVLPIPGIIFIASVAFLFFNLSLYIFPVALAHGVPFLKFSPDISETLEIANVAMPEQAFEPQNDFLSDFDFWVDNDGSPGPATFELINPSGEVLVVQTVTIPRLEPRWSGNRIHVDLPYTVKISDNSTYRIRIISSLPKLRLYYVDKTQLLQHTSIYYSEYFVRSAYLGSVEQGFAFKFVLGESEDNEPPVLTDVASENLTPYATRITVNANEPIDLSIDYTPDGGYTKTTGFTGKFNVCEPVPCEATLNVTPDTNYTFIVRARDEWGNEGTVGGSFTSMPPPTPTPGLTPSPTPSGTDEPTPTSEPPNFGGGKTDHTPPTIINIRIAELAPERITVAWTTDEIANTALTVRKDGDTVAERNDGTFEIEHLIATNAVLEAGTAYLAEVRSRDPAANEAISSFTFVTQERKSGISPSEDGVPPGSEYAPGGGEVTVNPDNNYEIVWDAGEKPLEGYRIDIFDSKNQYIGKRTIDPGKNNFWLTKMSSGEYTVVVYRKKNGFYERIGKAVPVRVKKGTINRARFYAALLAVFVIAVPFGIVIGTKRLIVMFKHNREWSG